LKGYVGDREGSIWKLMEALDSFIPEPKRENGQAVLDAGGGRFHDFRARDGGDRAN